MITEPANFDLALAIHLMVPEARYAGSTYPSEREAYDALSWTDERAKPSFEDILAFVESQTYLNAVSTLNAPALSRAEISKALKDGGLLTRQEAVLLASGAFPDSFYERDDLTEDEVFAAEIEFAGNVRHLRGSVPVDIISSLGLTFKNIIDSAYGISNGNE